MTHNQSLQLPQPRTPDSRLAPSLRWGVIGPGWIADKFVTALTTHTAQRVTAVGSRSIEKARRFAEQHGVPRAYGDYESLVAAPDVDIVYIATPHPLHTEHALLAMRAGKHVLVEKPMAVAAEQAELLRDEAQHRGVLLAEAFWSMFLPRYDIVRQVLDEGLLGPVSAVVADNGEWFSREHRIFNPELGGGPLFDLGTYPIGLATWALGPASEVRALSSWTETGVVGQTAAATLHNDGAQASIHMSILGATPVAASLVGERGTLELPGPFYMPGDVVLRNPDGTVADSWTEQPVRHEGLHWQASEVARRITAGETQTPLRPIEDTLSMLDVMDSIRAIESGHNDQGA